MILEKEYGITEEHCKTLIKGVCNGCCGELSPIETVDNSSNPTFWAHCPVCSKYHWGTPKKVVMIATKLVDDRNYIHYKFLDQTDPGYRESQISGTCGIVSDVLSLFNSIKE